MEWFFSIAAYDYFLIINENVYWNCKIEDCWDQIEKGAVNKDKSDIM